MMVCLPPRSAHLAVGDRFRCRRKNTSLLFHGVVHSFFIIDGHYRSEPII